jgi:hypothetical protein
MLADSKCNPRSQDRAFGGFIEGANNVEITGGNFHQTHGHHINLNLAIHLSRVFCPLISLVHAYAPQPRQNLLEKNMKSPRKSHLHLYVYFMPR